MCNSIVVINGFDSCLRQLVTSGERVDLYPYLERYRETGQSHKSHEQVAFHLRAVYKNDSMICKGADN